MCNPHTAPVAGRAGFLPADDSGHLPEPGPAPGLHPLSPHEAKLKSQSPLLNTRFAGRVLMSPVRSVNCPHSTEGYTEAKSGSWVAQGHWDW